MPKNVAEENISQEFRLKEINKTRNYFIEEIKQNELISKNYKKVCKILNYTEHYFSFYSSGCFSISAFDSLVDIPVGIASSATKTKISMINAGTKKYK